ncbi:MAG: hypothetical protein QXI19_11010, partial [Candidatus Caldarchaeum sp.]
FNHQFTVDSAVLAKHTFYQRTILASEKQYVAIPFVPSGVRPPCTLIRGSFEGQITIEKRQPGTDAGELESTYLSEVELLLTVSVVKAGSWPDIGAQTQTPLDYESGRELSLRDAFFSQRYLIQQGRTTRIAEDFNTFYHLARGDRLCFILLLSLPEGIASTLDIPVGTQLVRPRLQVKLNASYAYI